MKGVFVAGTDTDVGKTVVSAFLCHALGQQTEVTYFKPVQAGYPTDTDHVTDVCEQRLRIKPSTYSLRQPMSPNRAAALEQKDLRLAEILKDWDERDETIHVVEGAGGLLVPLNKQDKIIDLIQGMELPCLLVASTRLGTINHTLLSIEALNEKSIPCLGIVLNGATDPGLKELLEEQSGVPVVLELPTFDSVNADSFDGFLSKSEGARALVEQLCPKWKHGDQTAEDLEAFDKEYVWHPFTQHGIVKNHPVVTKGKDSYLYLGNHKVLDAISSWWVNLFGHCHPGLSRAVQDQAHQLEHVIYAGFSHEPGTLLAKRLVELARARGANLDKAFYSDNGSTSVEVALKLAYQFHQQNGDKHKTRFLAFRGSYHGDTLGAMSVGERRGFNEIFSPLLFEVDTVDPFDDEALQLYFEKHGDQCAAVILEPMVQGASGMRMYGAEVLDRLATLADRSRSLIICDEVFTGFYRTGKMFAFEHSRLKPDLLCLSKGLTGGYLPLAVTLVGQRLFDVFNNSDMRQAFLHGHSYTANPIACRVALASLDLIETSQTERAVQNIEQWTRECLGDLEQACEVYNVRTLGTIGAFEVNSDDPHYFKGDFSFRFHRKALEQGVLLRPLGGTIYTVPPYCMTKTELQKTYQVIHQIIKEEF